LEEEGSFSEISIICLETSEPTCMLTPTKKHRITGKITRFQVFNKFLLKETSSKKISLRQSKT